MNSQPFKFNGANHESEVGVFDPEKEAPKLIEEEITEEFSEDTEAIIREDLKSALRLFTPPSIEWETNIFHTGRGGPHVRIHPYDRRVEGLCNPCCEDCR